MPEPSCTLAPRPSQSPQTGPQKVEMDAQTQAQSPRDVFIVQVGSYCCEESTARMCAQLSAGPRTDTTLTDRKPPSCPLWERAWPGEARVVCKAKAGGLHLLRSPPTPAVRSASALWSLQVCRVRVGPAPQAMSVHPITHQCPQRGGRTLGGQLGPSHTGHFQSKRINW